ncbi:MAG TPA: hypothetical protein VGB13_04135, partial [Candidatus Krumholzibacteria bacterium]
FGQRLLFAVAVAVLPYVLASAPPATHAPASYDGVDPLLQSAVLLYSADTLPLDLARWNAPFFYPVPLSLSFMDPLLGQAAAVRWIPTLRGSVGRLYFAAFALSVGLAFIATIQLGRALGLSERQGTLAGLAFVLCPYAAAHWHHLNQLPSPWIPWALLGVLRLRRRDRGGAALLLFALCAQLAFGIYGLASALVVVLPLAAFCFWVGGRRERVRLLIALATFGAVLWLYSTPYRLAAATVEGFDRGVQESGPYAARIFDLWHGPRSHLMAWPSWIPGRGVIYPGWGLFALSVVAVGLGRRRGEDRGWILVALLAAAFGVVLAFGRSAPVPFAASEPSLPFAWLQDLLWPLRAIRASYRFFQPATLALALLAPVGATLLWARARPAPRAVLALLFALVVLDVAPGRLPRVRLEADGAERELITRLAARPDRPWTILPQPCGESAETAGDARAMQWAVLSGAPLVGGSSGFVPPSHLAMRSRCCGGANVGCIEALRAMGVRRVLTLDEIENVDGIRSEGRCGEFWCYELLP